MLHLCNTNVVDESVKCVCPKTSGISLLHGLGKLAFFFTSVLSNRGIAGLSCRTGRWSKEEDEQLKRNWKKVTEVIIFEVVTWALN